MVRILRTGLMRVQNCPKPLAMNVGTTLSMCEANRVKIAATTKVEGKRNRGRNTIATVKIPR